MFESWLEKKKCYLENFLTSVFHLFLMNAFPTILLSLILLGERLWDSCRLVRWVQMKDPTKGIKMYQ